MKTLTLLLLSSTIVLTGCSRKTYSTELTEPGMVYDTAFVPKGHGSDTAVGFDLDGELTITPVSVTIPARYAIVFQCQHGKFVIDGTKGEEMYKRLSRGDHVLIRYREVFEVSDGVTNQVDLDFVDADIAK